MFRLSFLYRLFTPTRQLLQLLTQSPGNNFSVAIRLRAVVLMVGMICLLPNSLSAQSLTMGEAIEQALANNFNLQFAKNNVRIASINDHPGQAGMLPVVGLQAGTTALVNNISQKFVSGDEINRAGVFSSNTQFSVFSAWTLFDGFRMYAARQRLKEQVAEAEIDLTAQMLQTTRDVAALYLELMRQQELLKNTDTLIAITNERLTLSKMRFESGLSSKTDYLQALTDVNAQAAQKLTQLNNLQQTKENLNLLMGRNVSTPFEIEEQSLPEENWVLPEELNPAQHPLVRQVKTQIGIAQLQQQEIEAGKYPTVDLNAAYNFNFNRSQAGFSLYNLSTGPVLGLNVNWTLFNGGNLKRAATVNHIAIETLHTSLAQTEQLLDAQWVQAQRNAAFARNLADLETKNLEAISENMLIALERLRAGVANTLEFREAQQSYELMLARKTEAQFQLKLAELNLLFLKGELIMQD